uniref:Uncharacterized protein n=1 Tax=Denticeps clupeoides TaxID=299321 RepID=A0AAY4D6P0_9TELE
MDCCRRTSPRCWSPGSVVPYRNCLCWCCTFSGTHLSVTHSIRLLIRVDASLASCGEVTVHSEGVPRAPLVRINPYFCYLQEDQEVLENQCLPLDQQYPGWTRKTYY